MRWTVGVWLSGSMLLGSTAAPTVLRLSDPFGLTGTDLVMPVGQTSEARPLVVLLHGGGNKGNDEMMPLAEALADEGMVVFVPTYDSSQPRSPEAVLETFEDVVCSVRSARATAAAVNADPDNLVLVGFSYGGFPAASLSMAPSDAYSFSCWPGVSHVPQAFVGLGGAYYYDWRVRTLFPDDRAAFFTARGAAGHRGESVPVTLVHGVDDYNVPVDHAVQYFEAVEESGRQIGLHVLATGHAELIDPSLSPGGAESVEMILEAAAGRMSHGRVGTSTLGKSPYRVLARSIER